MIFRQITTGRQFLLRMEHGDDLLKELYVFFENNKIDGAFVWILGALECGKCVAGPQKTSLPPDPIIRVFSETHEILGWGNFFLNDHEKPKIHLHITTGHGSETMMGCLRDNARVFLTCEVFVQEVLNPPVRKLDPESATELLDLEI